MPINETRSIDTTLAPGLRLVAAQRLKDRHTVTAAWPARYFGPNWDRGRETALDDLAILLSVAEAGLEILQIAARLSLEKSSLGTQLRLAITHGPDGVDGAADGPVGLNRLITLLTLLAQAARKDANLAERLRCATSDSVLGACAGR